jgi:threonine/homoserine/homoserine lactone efflux protein
MDISSLAAFALIFGVACASPGPTVAALVARVLSRGTAGMPAFCLGLLLGDLAWLACAAFGLAVVASLFQPVFLAIKYLGAAYLLFLAWKLWTAPAVAPTDARLLKGEGIRLFFGGLALALGNPKTMLFYLALLPTIIALANLSWLGFAELAGIVTGVYSAVLCGYVLLAARARRLFRSTRAMRIVNRTTGTAMAGAAVAVAARS